MALWFWLCPWHDLHFNKFIVRNFNLRISRNRPRHKYRGWKHLNEWNTKVNFVQCNIEHYEFRHHVQNVTLTCQVSSFFYLQSAQFQDVTWGTFLCRHTMWIINQNLKCLQFRLRGDLVYCNFRFAFLTLYYIC